MKTTIYFFTLLFLLVMLVNISAQNLPQIQVSPHAKILQEVGLSEITIDYHRPAVKGREVWGKLVPYGMNNLGFGTAKESPWRAGANENTVITISDDAKINGNMLPAGSYGLHIIVTASEWTIIFSKTTTAWGSFFYDPKDDALRITVTPEKCEFNEWLLYGFENLSAASADVILKWENLKAKFSVVFDVNNIVVDRFRKTLVGAAGFRAVNFQQAAAFCVANNINLDEAEVWINHALSLQETGMSLLTKAQLMAKRGNKTESVELEKKAMSIATEAELNTYGYNLMLQEKNIEKAIEIFKLNVEKFPTSWNVYDSLAEAYGIKGDKENSVKYYKKALDIAPENQKDRIQKAIESMK